MITNSHLISGETFISQNRPDTTHNFPPDDEINEKYKKGEIRIVTEQARYPLDSIKAMLDSAKYILNPEYQRRKRWDNARKSRLIESFIMNVPIPPIFLYEIEYSIYEVMDGQQRLTAIYDFYKGKFDLEGLEYWQELNGRNYQNLPEQVRRGIDRRYLSSIILLQETAKSKEEAEYLKQIVFERLNSGGEKLTAQETRNALQNGKFNQLCIKLSQNEYFRKMWNLPLESQGEKKLLESESYRKMEDVELVLRFFAYRHIDKLKSPVDKFLDEYLKQANSYPDETMNKLENIFNETIYLIYQILGNSAFIPPYEGRNRKTPLKTIYDPIMQVFANNISHKEIFLKHKGTIEKSLYSGRKSPFIQQEKSKHLFDGSYNNKKDVEARIQYFQKFLQTYIK
ncbi:MAG: DUF262 domain-containing protein [Microcoleus sp. PH2017_29_MFU_D_A]|uniref:DUF262 domain-containing protein n=1 Tax=unclassified Microcoleus TaxID=2642155 RepID=UPI001D6ADF0C|nr:MULTISPECIES: DUF262 domain-containing protein [unclassified Microcoleus]MCC3417275.1 DUF262 domain-containing protein [Microcoleus sp. PH2017_07_MST_O_A]MCC3512814.1 DUF262 domain-containing protein [Microcoleus sp. PH2017_17_BER_D_A]TAE68629.1 MAG: DUF262 domain-containing protein [Oscillatoriales cyanobacterium]MCC3427143.1 DUF262 domain-containing protein [Microcoleus sp. PH2017_01_SCD_O_A]MCC3438835.1 DUF262 domain-containing protein [Microcoleus sp. PH2017_05_CCC_O_A]